MSNIIEFTNRIDTTTPEYAARKLGILDGDINFATPLQLPPNSHPKMQVCAITCSDRIPNIFNAYPYYDFDNTLLRVNTDAVGSAYTIQLPVGLYPTVDDIAAAINSAIVANTNYYTNALQPAISITANVITDVVVIAIDTTKLNPAHGHHTLTMDLRKSTTGTMLAHTLGFSEGSALLAAPAGIITEFTSNQEVRMDTQGKSIDVQSSLISMRRRNDTYVRTLAIIPFAGKTTSADNIWPSDGQVSPMLLYEGSKTVQFMRIECKSLDGRTMVFMNGEIHVIIMLLA